jgi:hyperosmotically inducible protein
MNTSLPLSKLASLFVSISVLALGALTGGCAATSTDDSSSQYSDDMLITSKVKSALRGDSVVRSLDIQVETVNAVVQLSGFVDTSDQKFAAGQDAAAVAGVKDVQNNLIVRQSSDRSERDYSMPHVPQF